MPSSAFLRRPDGPGLTLRPSLASPTTLPAYASLFRTCFPGAAIANPAYLNWLYAENPSGPVVGFDAWAGDTLAAHYVCVPVETMLAGIPCRCLLSLNTATHPAWQGQGLFTRLAQATYEMATADGYAAVYGVANANSTPGFLRKLAFQAVAPLEARIGIGGVSHKRAWPDVCASSMFRRRWTAASLRWRMSNPLNPVQARHLNGQQWGFTARTGRPGVVAYGESWLEQPDHGPDLPSSRSPLGLRVFLGLMPPALAAYGRFVPLPAVLKPSPLNLIYRRLGAGPETLDPGSTLLGFLDFDAF
ncbi:GNAT family N-acetyltransferase [Insolitispirillum peregrinum]|uniref:Ribosomal protein S18 acetylase RimI n=1 Tax=Insolitispirillum peregrinum TaxID=80876 RepID=A0A1N7MCK5_9PROT|nr:GNAT family N-acetyltransferase [Insolitispirillum peregrinum]SIS83856.1 Ribosomal protein S18 acetylase RimI [Insolitispirillum peregrinum]